MNHGSQGKLHIRGVSEEDCTIRSFAWEIIKLFYIRCQIGVPSKKRTMGHD